ncbi:acyl-CoA dehydrogenase family protein [Microbulbifer harenosus]|uniref:Acyl-CoA oxidase C-alpha1 domain-containing protein n=1 Tax=Microbulbifer harenosus TaxID=2576840 RepID=A0ABY2UE98_9GAMM|nr:acyl-CoA dehydrogenase family protein [Microbulbifer harenosus]TLM74777.1 hypothetical protein FDY93_17250 [Microbulbifer harenosus]
MNLADILAVGSSFQNENGNIDDGLLRPIHNCDSVADKDSLYSCMKEIISNPEYGEQLFEFPEKLIGLHEVAAIHDGALFAALSIHYNLCVGTIKALKKDSEYLSEIYRELLQGEAVGVYLATELAYGNNVFSLESEAVYDHSRRIFILHSPNARSFKFMPNTSLSRHAAKIAVVMARLKVDDEEYGVMPFVVRIHGSNKVLPGINISEIGSKPGFGLDNCITSFNQVEVPFESLLSRNILDISPSGEVIFIETDQRKRFLQSMQRVQFGKICMAAGAAAAAKASLYITKNYGKQRETFSVVGDVPLISHSSFSQPLTIYTAALVVQSLWIRDLGDRAHREESSSKGMPEELKNEIALAKSLVTWESREVIVGCRELCGAQGMFSANKFSNYYAMTNGCITAEGDNVVIMQKAARDYLRSLLPFSVPDCSPSVQSILQVFHAFALSLHKEVQLGLRAEDKADYFSKWNQYSEKMMEMLDVYGTLCAAAAASSFIDDGRDSWILELFLLEKLKKIAPSILTSKIKNVDSVTNLLRRREDLLREKQGDVGEIIDWFGVEETGLKTPISGEDYISWYQRHHANNAAHQ